MLLRNSIAGEINKKERSDVSRFIYNSIVVALSGEVSGVLELWDNDVYLHLYGTALRTYAVLVIHSGVK